MKIAIGVSPITSAKVGAGYYTENLIKHLSETGSKNEYLLYSSFWKNSDSLKSTIYCPACGNFKLYTPRFPSFLKKSAEKYLGLMPDYYLLKKHKPDVFHATANILPVMPKNVKTVLSVLDLSFEINPAWYHLDWYREVRHSVSRADAIISISESTKKDLINIYGVDEKKITITKLACDAKYKKINDINVLQKTRFKYNLPERYILFVGGLRPIKNLPGIIEAVSILKKNSYPGKLVIAGKKVYPGNEIEKTITRLGMNNDVVFTGYVPTDELPAIFTMAEVFVFTSLYEGFGIPLVEAMSCGTPIVTSNVSSMPEVAGDAAVYADPKNIEEIASALKTLVYNPSLKSELSNNGLNRSRQFNWKKTAEATLSVYETIFKKK